MNDICASLQLLRTPIVLITLELPRPKQSSFLQDPQLLCKLMMTTTTSKQASLHNLYPFTTKYASRLFQLMFTSSRNLKGVNIIPFCDTEQKVEVECAPHGPICGEPSKHLVSC